MTHFLDESSLKTFPFDSLFSLYLIADFIWNSEIETWVLQKNRPPMRVIHFIRTVQSGGKEFVTGVRDPRTSNGLSIDWSTPFLWAIYMSKQVWIESESLRDVIPTDPEDDFPHQVVRIAYSPEFKDCFDYSRAIIEKGELSQGIGPKLLFSLSAMVHNLWVEWKV